MSEVIVNVKWYIVAPARNRDVYLCIRRQQQQQQHSLFSQASWGRLEMKPERNKFKVQAH